MLLRSGASMRSSFFPGVRFNDWIAVQRKRSRTTLMRHE
jgi:hypothetical protein